MDVRDAIHAPTLREAVGRGAEGPVERDGPTGAENEIVRHVGPREPVGQLQRPRQQSGGSIAVYRVGKVIAAEPVLISFGDGLGECVSAQERNISRFTFHGRLQ